jgi:hypothetical protein
VAAGHAPSINETPELTSALERVVGWTATHCAGPPARRRSRPSQQRRRPTSRDRWAALRAFHGQRNSHRHQDRRSGSCCAHLDRSPLNGRQTRLTCSVRPTRSNGAVGKQPNVHLPQRMHL